MHQKKIPRTRVFYPLIWKGCAPKHACAYSNGIVRVANAGGIEYGQSAFEITKEGNLLDNWCCATTKTGETNTPMHMGLPFASNQCTFTGETCERKCEKEDQTTKQQDYDAIQTVRQGKKRKTVEQQKARVEKLSETVWVFVLRVAEQSACFIYWSIYWWN